MDLNDLRLGRLYPWDKTLGIVFGPGESWSAEAARALSDGARPLSGARVRQIIDSPSDDDAFTVLNYGAARLEKYRTLLGTEGLDQDERNHFPELQNALRSLETALTDYGWRHPEAAVCAAAQRYAEDTQRRQRAGDRGMWGNRGGYANPPSRAPEPMPDQSASTAARR